MKDAVTTLFVLVIMVIGLALIVGGSGAVRFLFAPFIFGIRQLVRMCFVVLILIILVAVVVSSRTSSTKQKCGSLSAPSQNEIPRQEGEAGAVVR